MIDPIWERPGSFAFAKRAAITTSLEGNSFNIRKTAADLGVSRATLYRLFALYRIEFVRRPRAVSLVITEEAA